MRNLVLLVLVLSLTASCGGGSGGGGPAPVVVFQVAQVTPADQSSNVPLSAEVDVVFSGPVDPATVNDSNLRVVAETGDVIFGSRKFNPLSPGIIRFVPIQPYFPFAVHRIEVFRDVKDTEGRSLDKDYVFEFQTEEEGPTFPTAADVEDLGDFLVTGRWFHRMTLLPIARFLIAGGYGADNLPLDSAENLIPSLRQCTTIPDRMSTPRAAHVQVLLADGRVLLAGGEISNEPFVPTARCDIFDPATFTFHEVASMVLPRSFAHGVLLADGRVLVSGGQSIGPTGFHFRPDAEIYDPAADTWTVVAGAMSIPRSGHFSARLSSGEVIVIGGTAGAPNADLFDVAADEFRPADPPPFFDHFLAAATLLPDGRPIVLGGFRSLGVTIRDPDFGFLYGSNRMLSERVFATATAFADGRVLLVGGTDFSAQPPLLADSIDLFFPIGKSGKIARVPNLLLPRPTSHHAADRDPTGLIWITGGLPLDVSRPGLRQAVVLHPGD
jgi:hypothetical protein